MRSGERIRDYVLEKRIGSGGVGEVWRARHERLNKPVAIKLILPHLYQDENIYDRFVQEAIATANLEHPHIISVHDFFSVGEDTFLVMSYVEGGSLQDRIKKHGRLSLDETLYVARGILDALDSAHKKGIVHRDVKPSNILLSPDLHAYLVDFGIALVLGKTRITRFGANIGTPDYMSPEQIRGEQLDHRTDVYSFGCVLYEMLSGHSPFRRTDDDTEFTLMERHMNEVPVPLRTLNSQINEGTEAAVMRALAKDRDKRFAGCADMAKALLVPVSPSILSTAKFVYKTSTASKVAIAVLALTTLVSAGGWLAAYGEKEPSNSANPPMTELNARYAVFEKALKEVEELKAQLAGAKQTANAATGKLESELQAASAARDKAQKEAQDLRTQLASGERSDKTMVPKLQDELLEARTAYERSQKEIKQLRQQLSSLKERESQTALKELQPAPKERELQPAKKPTPIPVKPTREIARHLSIAKEQRERGAYDAALYELNAASALDPTNEEITAEIARTRRACNAEKKSLGQTYLKC